MVKKFIPLLILTTLPLVSCGANYEESKAKLAANINTYLYEKDNDFLTPNIDEILANLRVKAGFAIYFSNEGCSACEEFSPIINSYMSETNLMIYKYDITKDREEFNKLKESCGNHIFGESTLATPSLCVLHDDKVEYVDYDSYMKTQNAFNNYMNRTYQVRPVYYTKGNVFLTEFTNKEFAYVTFDYTNEDLVSLYLRKIHEQVYKAEKPVIVTDYVDPSHYDKVMIKIVGRHAFPHIYYTKAEYIITEEMDEETIKAML